jgi:hypothetical protein
MKCAMPKNHEDGDDHEADGMLKCQKCPPGTELSYCSKDCREDHEDMGHTVNTLPLAERVLRRYQQGMPDVQVEIFAIGDRTVVLQVGHGDTAKAIRSEANLKLKNRFAGVNISIR